MLLVPERNDLRRGIAWGEVGVVIVAKADCLTARSPDRQVPVEHQDKPTGGNSQEHSI